MKVKVGILRDLYFICFGLGVLFVMLMHTFDKPFFDALRVPSYIQLTSSINGLPYYPVFKIYQLTLVFSLLVILIDALCLTKYKSEFFVRLSKVTTLIGLGLLTVTLAYFSYNFIVLEPTLRQTSVIFLAASVFLMTLDLLTFEVDTELLEGEK